MQAGWQTCTGIQPYNSLQTNKASRGVGRQAEGQEPLAGRQLNRAVNGYDIKGKKILEPSTFALATQYKVATHRQGRALFRQ